MARFQGSGFSIEIPDGTVDASAYSFALPGAGGSNPTLVIKFEAAEQADLRARFDEQGKLLKKSLDNFELLSDGAFQRAGREYIVWVCEWGSAEARIKQKQVLMFVAGAKPRLFTITATDLAEHFAKTEPMFDNVIRTFDPNNVQVI